jgi:putative copper export protein
MSNVRPHKQPQSTQKRFSPTAMLTTIFILLALHAATIVVIRVTSGDIFANPKADLRHVMERLKRERPVAHRIYQASLALPVVYLIIVAIVRFVP